MKGNLFLKLVAAAGWVAGLAGCSPDFLERAPLDKLTDASYFTSAEEVMMATAPLYNVVWFDFNDKANVAYGDIRAGNMISNDRHAFYQFTASSTSEEVVNGWRAFYIVVSQANMAIYNINTRSTAGVPDAAKRHGLAEARYMRGLAYMYLVQNWGPVPIIDDNIRQMNDPGIRRNSTESIWEFVIRDLRYAAQNLPAVSVQPGRLNKYSAEGMLAKAFLARSGLGAAASTRNQTDLDSAKYYAGDVVKNGPFRLMDNYGDLFLMKNNNNSESMFALQWVYNGTWGTQNTFQAYFAAEPKITGSWDGWGASQGASAEYLKTMEARDSLRRKATFMLQDDLYPEILQKDGGYKYTVGESISNVKKYVIGTAADNGGKVDGMRTEIYTYMMRLAEVYLIYAEAILGNNASSANAEALQYFNLVRTRARMPVVNSLTYDDIFKERRAELAMEGQNWYDLVRLYYFNPAKALDIIARQDKGTYTVAVEPGISPRRFKFTYTPAYYPANSTSFWLPLPESELAKSPSLRNEPVDYQF